MNQPLPLPQPDPQDDPPEVEMIDLTEYWTGAAPLLFIAFLFLALLTGTLLYAGNRNLDRHLISIERTETK